MTELPNEVHADSDLALTTGADIRLRVDNGTHSGTIIRMATIPGANMFVTAGVDKRIRSWSGPEPRLVRTMIGDIGSGWDGIVEAIAVQRSKGTDLLWASVRRLPVDGGDHYSEIRLFDVNTGDVRFAMDMDTVLHDLAVTADGLFLVAVARQHLQVYDISFALFSSQDEPQLVASIEVIDNPFRLATTTNQGNNRIFLSSIVNSQPRVIDLVGGELVDVPFAASAPRPHRPDQLAASDRFLAVANHDGGDLWIYDLDGNAVQAVPGAGGGGPSELAFSPDGRLLIVGSKSGVGSVVTVHDTERDFVEVNRFRYDDHCHAVGFLDNNTVVSAGGSRFSLNTWPARAVSLRPTDGAAPETVERQLDGGGQVITAVGITGSKVALGFRKPDSEDELSIRMDFETLALQPIDPSDGGEGEPAVEDYQRAVHSDRSRSLRISDVDHNLILEPQGLPMTGHGMYGWGYAESYGLLPDDRVAVGERTGTVRVLRWEDDQTLRGRKLVGHIGAVLDLAADDDWLVTAGRDQVLRLWYLPDAVDESGSLDSQADALEPALSLFVSGREWVAWTRSGYYASSAEGERFISFHVNGGLGCRAWSFPADRFVELLYRPDIVRAVFRTGSEAAALTELGLDVEPPLAIHEHLPPIIEIKRVYEAEPYLLGVDLTVTDLAAPTTRVWALLDGLIEWEHEPVNSDVSQRSYGGSPVLSPEFWLEPGPNNLRFLAENESAKSIAVDLVVEVGDDGQILSSTDSSGAEVAVELGGVATSAGVEPASVVPASATPVAEPVAVADPGDGWAEPMIFEAGWFTGVPSVHVAGVETTLDIRPAESIRYLDASVDDRTVWSAVIEPEVDLSIRASFPLPDHGYSTVRVTETSDAGERTAFSADVEWDVHDVSEEDGDGVVDGGLVEPPDPDDGDLGTMMEPTPPLASGLIIVESERPEPEVLAEDSGPQLAAFRIEGSKGADEDRDPVRPRRPTRVRPQLFMLSVGVSKMKKKDQSVGDLKYAADDAKEIAKRLTDGTGELFDSVRHWLLTDEDATKVKVEAARDELVEAVRARSQQKKDENLRARDVVLLFFSSHGVTRRGDDGEPDDFYLVTHDFLDDNAAGTGTLFADLVKPFFELRDFELVVLVDACRSARAGLAFIDRIDPEELAKRLKAPSEQAQHFLCSTSGDQISWERALAYPYHKPRARKKVGHGLFTHAIIKQMDEADTVSISGLASGVGEALYNWTINWSEAKLQEPTHYLYGGGRYLRLYRRR